jgi:hypothetical protein
MVGGWEQMFEGASKMGSFFHTTFLQYKFVLKNVNTCICTISGAAWRGFESPGDTGHLARAVAMNCED